MYMQKIVRAQAETSPLARRLLGVPVLALSAVVMVPWLALYGLWSAIAIAVRAAPKAPRTLLDMVDYAGTVALGR